MMSQILNQALAYDPAVVPYDREQGLDSSLNENAQVSHQGRDRGNHNAFSFLFSLFLFLFFPNPAPALMPLVASRIMYSFSRKEGSSCHCNFNFETEARFATVRDLTACMAPCHCGVPVPGLYALAMRLCNQHFGLGLVE